MPDSPPSLGRDVATDTETVADSLSKECRGRKACIATVVVLLSFLISFQGLEGFYRVYKLAKYGMVDYPDPLSVGYFEQDPHYGMVAKKNFSSDGINPKLKKGRANNVVGFDKKVSFNQYGYRGRDFLVQKPPNIVRIVVLGGSTTIGLETDDDDTWPATLERKLSADTGFLEKYGREKAEVINAAMTRFRSREALLRLQSEVWQFHPDIILAAINWNDSTHGTVGIDPESVEVHEQPWWYQFALFQNLAIRYSLWQRNKRDYWGPRFLKLNRNEQWAKVYERNIVVMNEISRQIGARLILVNLPGLCRERAIVPGEYEEIIRRDMHISADSFPFWIAVKSFESAFLRDLGCHHDIPVIDVHRSFEMFSGRQRVDLFTDEMHHSAQGTEQIAEAIRIALVQGVR